MTRIGRWLRAYSLPLALAVAGTLFLLHGLGWAYPKPSGYVNDFANLLTDKERATLNDRIIAIRNETKVEMVIVTIPSLEGKDAESYARGLGNEWGVGIKGKDNGLILLIAPTEKKWFFKSGYGMEAMLPDSRLGTIGRNTFVPLYRQKKVGQAFADSVEVMYQDIKRYQAKDVVVQVPTKESESKFPYWVLIPIIGGGALLLTVILLVLRHYEKKEEKERQELQAMAIASAPIFLAPRPKPRIIKSSTPEKRVEEDRKARDNDDDYRPSRSSHSDDDDHHSHSGGSSGWDSGSSGGFGGGSFGGGGAGGDL